MTKEEDLPDSLFLETIGGRAAMSGAGGGGKHVQKAGGAMMTCSSCVSGLCENCVDRLRLVYSDNPICSCRKGGHEDAVTGEPRRQQILDPETNSIHTPGLVISPDGDVKYV